MSAGSKASVCETCITRDWRRITVADGYLRLSLTLPGGQSFRWRDLGLISWSAHSKLYREWAGVVSDRILVLRQQEEELPAGEPETVYFRLEPPVKESVFDAVDEELRDYFRADFDLRPVVKSFCDADENFKRLFPHYRGARILRQPPVECFFAFICSSNNNIKRISAMVTHLAEEYGECVGEYVGQRYFAFPTVEQIAKRAREDDLRDAGFGYRAKFIVGSAKTLVQIASKNNVTPNEYLIKLRTNDRKQVSDQLIQFPGIGRKVAGCIALMSMDQFGEIPCDTHVWHIATRYMPSLAAKTLTPRIYESIGDFFRGKFGNEYAGIAHNTLFIAELSDFKDRAGAVVKNVKTEKAKARKASKRKMETQIARNGEKGGFELKARKRVAEKHEKRIVTVKVEDTVISMPKKKVRRTQRSKAKVEPTL